VGGKSVVLPASSQPPPPTDPPPPPPESVCAGLTAEDELIPSLNISVIKGTVSQDFLLLVFFMNYLPPSPAEIFASHDAPPAANYAKATTGVVDTGGKFATSVNDTGGKIATVVNNTGVRKNMKPS
jgi:hypothetical protein